MTTQRGEFINELNIERHTFDQHLTYFVLLTQNGVKVVPSMLCVDFQQ